MTQDPDQPPLWDGGADPLDDTQPVDVPRFAPTPEPRPDTRWAWAPSEPRPADRPSGWTLPAGPSAAGPSAAGPASAAGPSVAGPSWVVPSSATSTATPEPSAWAAPASSATTSWAAGPASAVTTDHASAAAEPASAAPARVAAAPVAPAAQHRSGPGVGTVAAVALLCAVLASSGTVLALSANGAFNPPPAVSVPVTTGGGTTPGANTAVTDESSAIINSFAKVSPAVVKITANGATSSDQGAGVGSGIIYDAGGWILTNHHVVTGAGSLTVELKDGRSFPGTVYGIDTLTDLAIVKVDATGLPVASLGSSEGLKVGQLVVAVGSPLGTYSFSVTSGIVSGEDRSIQVSDGSTISNLVQTDAAINPGNSGGPLTDANGNVVGVNTAVADGSAGIGFAIPIDIAKPIMSQALKGETLERPWIGIRYEAIDQKVKQAESLAVDNGALLTNTTTGGGSAIQSNSPAATAGLKDGDIITAVNGIVIDQEHPLNLLLVQFAPKDTVQLTVIRAGQTITVPLTLGVRPNNLQ